MASIEENYHFWNNAYDWERYQGDEWSARWGGADLQWRFCLYPRLARFLPTPALLEIGPGHGRFTHYLLDQAQEMTLVDLSDRCIQACKVRFSAYDTIRYRVNDGRSLPGVDDESIDLVFSFESLVHAEQDVLVAYLEEIYRVLKPGGSAFLHHSNRGVYGSYFRLTEILPKAWRRTLKRAGWLDFGEWRAASVTAETVSQACRQTGLACSSQELIPWGGNRLIDCFSVVSKKETRPPLVVENRKFIQRAYQIQRLARLYGQGVPW